MAHTFPELCLFLLRVYGFNPYINGKFELLRRMWVGCFFSMVVILFLLELLMNFQGVKTISRAIELGPVLFLTILKLIYLVRQPANIRDMFERGKISLTTTINNEIQDVGFKSMERWKKWFEIFVGVNVLVSIQVTIESMMERKPFIMAYLEDEKANDLLYCVSVILINVIFMLSTITTVLGYEGTFIYFIAYAVAEIKMVKLAFKSYRFTSKEGRETFNKILDHHVHILNFIQDVSDRYSFILLCQYLTSLSAVCFALFLMTLDGMPPDFDHITRYGNLSVTYLLQLAILCIAGDILTNECSGIGDIMFHKDWDENLINRNYFAMATVMIIQRTQKSAALSIGGFTELNLESFGEVVKSAMSFLTFMQTVYEEKGGKL